LKIPRWVLIKSEKTYRVFKIFERLDQISQNFHIFSLSWCIGNKIIGGNIWLKAQKHTKAVDFKVDLPVLFGLVRAESHAPLPMGYHLFRSELRKVLVSITLMSTMSFLKDKSPRRHGAEESKSNVREHVAWECHTGGMHVMDSYILVTPLPISAIPSSLTFDCQRVLFVLSFGPWSVSLARPWGILRSQIPLMH